MKEIIGHTIAAVRINEDATLLEFTAMDGQRFAYRAEGDCCNQVWFNHMNNVSALLGSTVLSVEAKDWVPMNEDRVGGDEYEELGLWSILTLNGHCDIEVRNNHNGYYGGTISPTVAFPDEFAGGTIFEDF